MGACRSPRAKVGRVGNFGGVAGALRAACADGLFRHSPAWQAHKKSPQARSLRLHRRAAVTTWDITPGINRRRQEFPAKIPASPRTAVTVSACLLRSNTPAIPPSHGPRSAAGPTGDELAASRRPTCPSTGRLMRTTRMHRRDGGARPLRVACVELARSSAPTRGRRAPGARGWAASACIRSLPDTGQTRTFCLLMAHGAEHLRDMLTRLAVRSK